MGDFHSMGTEALLPVGFVLGITMLWVGIFALQLPVGLTLLLAAAAALVCWITYAIITVADLRREARKDQA